MPLYEKPAPGASDHDKLSVLLNSFRLHCPSGGTTADPTTIPPASPNTPFDPGISFNLPAKALASPLLPDIDYLFTGTSPERPYLPVSSRQYYEQVHLIQAIDPFPLAIELIHCLHRVRHESYGSIFKNFRSGAYEIGRAHV